MVTMKKLLFALFLCWTIGAQAQQAVFQINPPTQDSQIVAAMNYAGAIWSQYLQSDVPIKIDVFLVPSGGNFLGLTLPNGRKNLGPDFMADTWYPACLANAILGMEVNPGEADMNIFMDLGAGWYFGTDGNCPSNKYDFVSVFLHEIGHGLGLLSLAKVEAGQGSFGEISIFDFAPLGTSFPFPDLEGLPSIYDRLVETGGGDNLTDTALFANPGAPLEDAFTGNNLYFAGALATSANSDSRPRVFAPASYLFGSSVTHFDENTYPEGNPNSLMTPFIGQGEVEHDPGPVMLGLLADLGWTVTEPSSTFENRAPVSLALRQLGLAEPILHLNLPEPAEVAIRGYALDGRLLWESFPGFLTTGDHMLPIGQLPAGLSVVRVSAGAISGSILMTRI